MPSKLIPNYSTISMLFALAGPFIGTLAIGAPLLAHGLSGVGVSRGDNVFASVVFLAIGEIVGFLPALLSGLAFGAILEYKFKGRINRWHVNAAIGLALGLLFSAPAMLLPAFDNPVDASVVLVPGAIAGAICGTISGNWRRVQHDSSPNRL